MENKYTQLNQILIKKYNKLKLYNKLIQITPY